MSVLETLAALRQEFYSDDVTEERQVEILHTVSGFAAEAGSPVCIHCKKPGLDIPHTHALVEGHCYSRNGVKEFRSITGLCEWCWDKIMADPEEDSDG